MILKKAKEKHFKVNIFDPTGLITQGAPGSIQELQVDITKAEKGKVEAAVTNGITTKKYHISRHGRIEQIEFVEQNVFLDTTLKEFSQMRAGTGLQKRIYDLPGKIYPLRGSVLKITDKSL
ncbi:MAG: hypothetical protein ACYS76_08600 [Planctomycetota bacterium]